MKNQVYFGIAIRIIILFCIGMFATFLPEHLRDFFGDHRLSNSFDGGTDVTWSWGKRHYWYYWMMVFLFILSLINFVLQIVRLINKHYSD